eukprot:TRINITY_DN13412_c0_g1_i1.p1 TRINITY_DN13412_c0_g1~~TRINITY_DN13412_c0_g1_i1.p1  ORF type:complete len:371 (+),score=48.01 TRINITY_DN13412_c0_g1_i1:314-1426(+)
MSESNESSVVDDASCDAQKPSEATMSRKLGAMAVMGSILIFSSNAAVYKELFASDPDTFTACNVLCGSNLVGLITLAPFFRKDLTRANLKAVTRVEWLALFFGTLCYSVFGPFFYLQALQQITVPTAAILQQLESPAFLLLSILLMGEAFDCWSVSNAGVLLLGTVLSIVSSPLFGASIEIGTGHMLMMVASLFFVGSLFMTKKYLSEMPRGILIVFRLGTGTLFYHAYLEIMNIFSGDRMLMHFYLTTRYWKHMWWYALLYVTLGQAMWIFALGNADATTISIGTASRFVLTLIWGILIMQAYPTSPEVLGSIFIVISVASGLLRSHKRARQMQQDEDSDEAAEEGRPQKQSSSPQRSLDYIVEGSSTG